MLPAQAAAAASFEPNLVVLGLVSQLLAGALFLSAVARSQPRQMLAEIFGTSAPDLSALRSAVLSRMQNMAGALCFGLGILLLLCGFLKSGGRADWRLQIGGAALLIAGLAVFLVVSQRFADQWLRHFLREQLRRHPIVFEEHLALTRQIGDLFGVSSQAEDTLESYCARLRQALGISEPPPRAARFPVPRYGYRRSEDSVLDAANRDSA